MTSGSEELRPVVTARSLVIGLLLCFLLSAVFGYYSILGLENISFGHPGFVAHMWVKNYPGRHTAIMTMPSFAVLGFTFSFLVIAMVLPKRWRFNPAELAFITASVMIIPIYSGGDGVFWWVSSLSQFLMYGTPILEYVSPLLFPTDEDILLQMQYGGVVVPWNAWILPLVFQMAFWVIFRLYFFFGSCLVQKLYIDVEALPFPIESNVTNNVISLAASKSGEESGVLSSMRSKILLLGSFILGFTWWLVTNTYYWYPPLTGLVAEVLYIDLTPYGWANGPLLLNFDFNKWGWLIIMPIDVTVTMPLAWSFFYLLMPSVLVATDIMQPLTPGTDMWTAEQNVGIHYSPMFFGIILALAIVPLFRLRRNIIDSIKAVKIKSNQYFISPRILWGGWGLTALALVAFFAAMSIPVWYGFITLAYISCFLLGIARAYVKAGLFTAVPTGATVTITGQWSTYFLNYSFGLAAPNAATVNSSLLSTALTIPHCVGYQHTNPLFWNLSSFKLAQLTKTDMKKMAVAILAGSLIPLLMWLPASVWMAYTYGWETHIGWTSRSFFNAFSLTQGRPFGPFPRAPEHAPPSAVTFAMIAISFAVIAAIDLARARFGGLMTYISPVGIVFALYGGVGEFFVGAIIISIVKLIVYRIGGGELFRENILPIGIGLVMAQAFSWMFWFIESSLIALGYVWFPQ